MRGVRRRGAGRSGADAALAGRRAQDGQRAGRCAVAEGGNARGYARLPGFEPDRADDRLQNAVADRTDARKKHSFAPAAYRPPLADSARTLRLHGPRPEVRCVWHCDVVPQVRRRPQSCRSVSGKGEKVDGSFRSAGSGSGFRTMIRPETEADFIFLLSLQRIRNYCVSV